MITCWVPSREFAQKTSETIREVNTAVKMHCLGGRKRVFKTPGIGRGLSRGVAAILPGHPPFLFSHDYPQPDRLSERTGIDASVPRGPIRSVLASFGAKGDRTDYTLFMDWALPNDSHGSPARTKQV